MTRDQPARASQWQAGMITPHAGLALLGEFAVGLGLLDLVDRYLPKPGIGAGYNPSEYTSQLILMVLGREQKLNFRRQELLSDLALMKSTPIVN